MKRAVARWLALFAVMGMAALAVWWFASDRMAPQPAAPAAAQLESSSKNPNLARPESVGLVSSPSNSDQPHEAASDERSSLESTLDALVHVSVVSAVDRAPIADVNVYVDSRTVPVEQFWRYCGEAPGHTGERGAIDVRIPAGRPTALQLRPSSTWKPTVLELDPVAAGAQVEREVALVSTVHLVLYARVLDAAQGEPVRGARARAGRWEDGAILAIADAEGLLRIEPIAPGTWVRIGGDGYCTEWFSASDGHATPETALEVELEPGATVRAHVLERGLPARDVTLRAGLGDSGGHAVPSSSGICTLDGLPSGDVLSYDLVRGDDVLAYGLVEPALEHGEIRELEIRVGDGALVRGRVIDSRGSPLASWRVGLDNDLDRVRADKHSHRNHYASVELNTGRYRTALTSPQGEFAFEGVRPGAWFAWAQPSSSGKDDLFVGRVSRSGAPDADRRGSATATRFLVPDGAEPAEVVLQVLDSQTIDGVVVDDEGGPFEMVWVHARAESEGIPEHILSKGDMTSANGSFTLGPLQPGRYKVSATADGHWCTPVEVEAGATGVRVVLRASGSVRGRILDDTGAAADGGVRLCAQRVDEVSPSRSERTLISDRFTFELPPGSYTFLASDDQGQVAILEGVRVDGGQETEVDLKLEPGGFVELTSEVVDDTVGFTVMRGDLPIDLDFMVDGKTERVTVPSGDVQVYFFRASALVGAQQVSVDPGQTVAVRFEKP